MDNHRIERILLDFKNNDYTLPQVLEKLRFLPYEDIDYAKIDHHRQLRTGCSEVIFCEGKTKEQVLCIVEKLIEHNDKVMATRVSQEQVELLKKHFPALSYYVSARIVVISKNDALGGDMTLKGKITVVSAGTADIGVAEEAAITAEFLGSNTERLYDVGVAGLHRLLDQMKTIREANVLIVVAGMEGALPSVLAGLVDIPIVAVPTSIGYGANFGGLAPLLTMLNSCAAGVGVVNIDNGFGAAQLAHLINVQDRYCPDCLKGKFNEGVLEKQY